MQLSIKLGLIYRFTVCSIWPISSLSPLPFFFSYSDLFGLIKYVLWFHLISNIGLLTMLVLLLSGCLGVHTMHPCQRTPSWSITPPHTGGKKITTASFQFPLLSVFFYFISTYVLNSTVCPLKKFENKKCIIFTRTFTVSDFIPVCISTFPFSIIFLLFEEFSTFLVVHVCW